MNYFLKPMCGIAIAAVFFITNLNSRSASGSNTLAKDITLKKHSKFDATFSLSNPYLMVGPAYVVIQGD